MHLYLNKFYLKAIQRRFIIALKFRIPLTFKEAPIVHSN